MKLLINAVRQAGSLASRRVWALLAAVTMTLIPRAALAAGGGENVKLHLSSSDTGYILISLGLGIFALFMGYILSVGVMKQSAGSEKMQSVGKAIKDGALAYLSQQIRTMLVFVAVLCALLIWYDWELGPSLAIWVGVSFVGGVAASYFAGFMGMIMAVNGNMRTAHAALTSYKQALEVAFRSGAVAGMLTVGAGLIGASIILLFAKDNAMTLLIGFGFGGSLAALFMRVGGGIFTKAADVGADLVGKVEAGIPEDDPRNPATIADNVGDNVGDCAGMAADIFESYEVTLVAAIVLGAATSAIFNQDTWMKLILFALMARGVGVIASVIGIYMVKGTDDLDADPLKSIRRGFYSSAAIAAVLTIGLAWYMMGGKGGSDTIVTQQLISSQQIELNDVGFLKGIQLQIAKDKNEEPYQVSAADLTSDPKVKERGFAATDQVVLASLNADLDKLPKPESLDGYHKVTNFSDPSIPELNYATKSVQTDPAVPPAKQFQTIGSMFGSTGADQQVIAEVHIHSVVPAAPAAPGRPAGTPTVQDRTVWAGPFPQGPFEKQIQQQQTQLQAQKSGSEIDVKTIKPVSLYYSDNGDIALGISSDVKAPYKIQGGTQYYKYSADKMNALAASPAAAAGQIPPAQAAIIGMENAQTVPWWTFALMIGFGIIMAFAIEMLTDYYVSTHKRPTQEVAGVASAGPAPMIIQGFAYACESSVFMVFAIVVALLFPLFFFTPSVYGGYILSFYGIALVGLGLLTTTGFILAMDTFGPISDNAQGVYEMSGEGHNNVAGSKAVQRLDAAGNTTKALTKGFAITTAVVAAVALFHSYIDSAHLAGRGLPLDVPEIFLGLLVGGAAPFLFSAFAINAVGRASFQLINEVRRQFREDPGIMLGTSLPNYARCVAIVTAAAQKELLGPGILAISLPIAVGFGFSIGKPSVVIQGHAYNLTGAQALGGFLAGAILSGQLLAVLLANSGGMWDNAKKLIEDGLFGGKGTEAHKAGIVCDTVGDPFKDTAGPALNPLIKVMNLVALLLASKIVLPLANSTLIVITSIALIALAGAIYQSKKGSMSTALQAATAAGAAGDNSFSHPVSGGQLGQIPVGGSTPMTPSKKKLLIEDEPGVSESPLTEAEKDHPAE